jgi:hypothetical protein
MRVPWYSKNGWTGLFVHAPHFTEIATLPQSLPILLNQYNITYEPKYLK